MQIKKEEIRVNILQEAEKEFLEKGFENASLRKIVKSAGTTIGNFYNYFESKEKLFNELVESEYNEFIHFIQNHDQQFKEYEYLENITDINELGKVIFELLQSIMPILSNKFLILIEGSNGTRFENTKDIILSTLRGHLLEHIQMDKPNNFNPELSDIISDQFLNGIILIIKQHKEANLRKQLLTELILFYIYGTMGLMGK